jgi:hypothetical protein
LIYTAEDQKRGANLAVSKFKATMNIFDDSLSEEEEADKIKNFADTHGLVLFFKKDKDYFGASEDSRVVFARLKNPDDEVSDGWEEEANFSAINLSKLVKGDVSQHVFSKSDIKKIKIMDQEKVIDALKGSGTDSPKPFAALRIIKISAQHSRDDAPNFTRADEE